MGPTVYRPYPRRIEYLTICERHSKGRILSSIILRLWVLILWRTWPSTFHTAVRRSTTWTNQAWLPHPDHDPYRKFVTWSKSFRRKKVYGPNSRDSKLENKTKTTHQQTQSSPELLPRQLPKFSHLSERIREDHNKSGKKNELTQKLKTNQPTLKTNLISVQTLALWPS